MFANMLPTFSTIALLFLVTDLVGFVLGAQILKTSAFYTCLPNSNMTVQNLDIKYKIEGKELTFNVAGTSTSEQNVTAHLKVMAYGINVYQRSFDPCSSSTYITQLCPVPIGQFSANGTQLVPEEYASQIPKIAFSVPDISAVATLQLKSLNNDMDVACINADVNNGKTVHTPAVSYFAAGIAGAALIMTGATAAGTAAGAAGGGITSGAHVHSTSGASTPSFIQVFSWFQGLAMNGMLSVNYPPIYRSFTKNFAFSTGIIPWTAMQISIDNFRQLTGGNLTESSVRYLKGSHSQAESTSAKISRRALQTIIMKRDSITTSVNNTPGDSTLGTPTHSSSLLEARLNGIKAYVEELSVPEANTFLTVLLVVACVIASIVVGILFCKVVLEVWALFDSLPRNLAGFRKHYWSTMARSIVQLILILYGIWVLYCIFQFTHGDSWAAKSLAAVSLTIFSSILIYFAYKIWRTARKLERLEGDASGLYQDKDNWLKYSMFYDSYSKEYWWMFLPAIIYMFAKGCALAAGNSHGLAQTIAQLIIEFLMLGLLIWNRPFERRSGNILNIVIQVVRGLSVACILVFVEELGITQTTQTVTGVVLIAVQSILTGFLAILIATNAIIMLCKQNPHRKRRKEAGKYCNNMDESTISDFKEKPSIDPFSTPKSTSLDPKSETSITKLKPTIQGSQIPHDSVNMSLDSLPKEQIRPHFRPEMYHHRGHRSDSQDGLLDSISRESLKHQSGEYRGVAW
ncbi:hypothetical protein Golomagni_03063 [Golovinomyces magnicellulatus]|nr:hypothetical protein Golomagni_03063 [Golovinomyces magnicellulatus]